jgi:carboxyl-terminal processing protease
MNKFFSLLAFLTSFSFVQGQAVIKSNKSNIPVFINSRSVSWSIDPATKPDRLLVYCSKDENRVVFKTDVDSAVFIIRKADTCYLRIILKSTDTAFTEIIGIKDLPDKITVNEKVFWLSQIWSEAKYNFVNMDRLTFDFDSLYKAFIPQVLATKNDYEFYATLKKFLAFLRDGHTQVSDNGQFYRYMDYVPVTFRDFDKRVYIVSVRKDIGLDSTWVGAELTAINDIPTTQYLESNVFPFISASTEQHLWMQGVYRLHSDVKDRPFRGTIQKRDGSIEKIVLQHNGEEMRTDKDQYWGPLHEYSSEITILKWLPDSIACVSYNRFAPEQEAINAFDRIAPELTKARGVIIDLRTNGGGSTTVGWQLQKYLTKGNYFLNYAWETRINDGAGKANGNWLDEYRDYFLNKACRFEKPDTVFVSDTLRRISCPVVILIGRYTFSAAEDFLVNIYELPNRPVLIGEETGGSTGSPLLVPGLPGGGYARICTRRICYPIGMNRFVNSGINPDIEVKQTIEEYLNGNDIVLEQACKWYKTIPLFRK